MIQYVIEYDETEFLLSPFTLPEIRVDVVVAHYSESKNKYVILHFTDKTVTLFWFFCDI